MNYFDFIVFGRIFAYIYQRVAVYSVNVAKARRIFKKFFVEKKIQSVQIFVGDKFHKYPVVQVKFDMPFEAVHRTDIHSVKF